MENSGKALDIFTKKTYSEYVYRKPLIRKSIPLEYFQRAADGGNAVVGRWENGPKRANPNRFGSRGDVSARYSRACMLVHGREHS